MKILDEVMEKAMQAPPLPETVIEALNSLVEAGRNMTAADRLEQKRYNLYGTPNPDQETRERIDRYMKRNYGV